MKWLNYTNIKKMDYFKSRLNKGVCKSLKKERPDDHDDFMYLFKWYHPEKQTKLKDVIDLCIVNNKRNFKYYEVNLIREDGTVEDISYRCCINKPYDEFLRDNNIPTTFDDNYYNSAVFKKEDKVFENEWIEYHMNNCLLRCLCKNCNLTRERK